MKKKVYNDPEMEIIFLENEDIICASGDLNESGADNGIKDPLDFEDPDE